VEEEEEEEEEEEGVPRVKEAEGLGLNLRRLENALKE